MLALFVATALSAQGVADSPFRLRPETSRVRLLAQSESGALTPPPMPVSPQAEPWPSFPPQRVSARLVDPDANRLNAKEVLVGIASGVGVHLVAGATLGFGLLVAIGAALGGSGAGGPLAFAALGALLAGLVLELCSPLLIAYFESLAADKNPMAGSFGKSVGLAYAAFGVATVLYFVLNAIAVSSATANMGLVFIGGLASAVLFLVGVPMAASFGRHWGPATPEDLEPPATELFPRTEPLFAALPKPLGGLGVSLRF